MVLVAGAGGMGVTFAQARSVDVADEQSIAATRHGLQAHYRLDVLVNNAGMATCTPM
nr:C121 [uncultured bacterium]ART37621.1 E412 [uncultured bacterium]